MQRVALDLSRFGLTATQARYACEENPGNLAGELVHSLVAWFACEPQQPYVYETPATWWDQLKASLPSWLQRWLGAPKTVRHQVDVKTVYPYLKTKLPPNMLGPQVVVCIAEKPAGAFLPEGAAISRTEWNQEAAAILFSTHHASAEKCPFCKRAMYSYPPR